MESIAARLHELARRYVWWSPAERIVSANLPRLVAQVMESGTWEDSHALLALLGRGAFEDVLRQPPPGILSARSWAFWKLRLDRDDVSQPPLTRRIPSIETADDARG